MLFVKNRIEVAEPPMTFNPTKRSLYYHFPVFFYACLIFVLSSIPKYPIEFPPYWQADKIVHFTEYFILGLLLVRVFCSSSNPRVRGVAVFLTFLAGTAYGLSDEWHQSFVPGRIATGWDVLFDGLGVLAAGWLYRLMRREMGFLRRFEESPERA